MVMPKFIPLLEEEYRSKGNRFLLTICVALGCHIFILFGIGFTSPFKPHPQNKNLFALDVTLVKSEATTPPDKAFLIGPSNKRGALGREAAQHTLLFPSLCVPPLASTLAEKYTTLSTPHAYLKEKAYQDLLPAHKVNKVSDLTPAGALIQPLLTLQENGLHKRTISAAQHQSKDAQYLAMWQKKVEDFGNAHYPTQAKQQHLQGELRLLVGVNKDGSIHNILLRRSSNQPILDQAAIEIVQNAAPFDPLPPEVAKEVDVLEIIRTFQFRGNFIAKG